MRGATRGRLRQEKEIIDFGSDQKYSAIFAAIYANAPKL
jgi:hypothetical protein